MGLWVGHLVEPHATSEYPAPIQKEALHRHTLLQEKIFEAQQAAVKVGGAGVGMVGRAGVEVGGACVGCVNRCAVCCRQSRSRGCDMLLPSIQGTLGDMPMTPQVDSARLAPLTL